MRREKVFPEPSPMSTHELLTEGMTRHFKPREYNVKDRLCCLRIDILYLEEPPFVC